jgi:Galactose oxidase, central domain
VDSVNSGPDARVGHTMTITSSGKIIIIGGLTAIESPTLDAQGYMQWTLTDASSSDIPHYDTSSGLWNLVTATGSIPPARTLHTATLGMPAIYILFSYLVACDSFTEFPFSR